MRGHKGEKEKQGREREKGEYRESEGEWGAEEGEEKRDESCAVCLCYLSRGLLARTSALVRYVYTGYLHATPRHVMVCLLRISFYFSCCPSP